ncbi:hypothetical protein BSQ44_06985 [Aquibium oceanicum]|uniref:Uncharacterized protein n=1 Tax=Aquibium oceanicum TaxID=1670800 RepID=A0A1L3SP17_9HYPH|nr:hypothetical protein BSQ44_06985 [Aquibium oceanicum]
MTRRGVDDQLFSRPKFIFYHFAGGSITCIKMCHLSCAFEDCERSFLIIFVIGSHLFEESRQFRANAISLVCHNPLLHPSCLL